MPGIVIVNTGPGKGKTTAAVGAALRAAGTGKRVLFLQFIKAKASGELTALEKFETVKVRQMGHGFILKNDPKPEDLEKARQAFKEASDEIRSNNWDLVVLDEICIALYYGLVEPKEVIDLIKSRPADLHLILTGRNCPEEILQAADTVTKMEAIRHHYDQGIKSQEGIEY
jgi:cob(I)alamin adenosyltransferase